MLGVSLCKAGNLMYPAVLEDWWLSFRESLSGLCKKDMCPFPIWVAGPVASRTFSGGSALYLQNQSSGKPLLCPGAEFAHREVGFNQAQIPPIQVYEVREAGDLILEAAAREDSCLERWQRWQDPRRRSCRSGGILRCTEVSGSSA